jgi:hypothetical protein
MSTENTIKQYTTTQAPEGYWTDARGVLTPVSLIKETTAIATSCWRTC